MGWLREKPAEGGAASLVLRVGPAWLAIPTVLFSGGELGERDSGAMWRSDFNDVGQVHVVSFAVRIGNVHERIPGPGEALYKIRERFRGLNFGAIAQDDYGGGFAHRIDPIAEP